MEDNVQICVNVLQRLLNCKYNQYITHYILLNETLNKEILADDSVSVLFSFPYFASSVTKV